MRRLKAYLDGSYNITKNIGGWAYVLLDEQDNILDKNSGALTQATNNICELYALYSLIGDLPEKSYVEVYSDSQYLVNMFTAWKEKFLDNPYKYKNYELIKAILNIIEEKELTVNFYWVKGHSDNKYNNLANDLANKARIEKEKALENAEANLIRKNKSETKELELISKIIVLLLEKKPINTFIAIKNKKHDCTYCVFNGENLLFRFENGQDLLSFLIRTDISDFDDGYTFVFVDNEVVLMKDTTW